MRLLLLALTTGYQTRAFREAVERLGAAVTLGTDRCHVLDDPWRDGAIALRFDDPGEDATILANASLEQRFDGIAAVGDRPLPSAAAAAKRLGLPFHTSEGVRFASDKFLSRQVFREAGLLTPRFEKVKLDEDECATPRVRGFPCVLKPLALSGSQGVIRADNQGQFRAAFRRIAHLLNKPEIASRNGRSTGEILVESFIPGREFALEGLVHQGSLKILALFDKPDPLNGPFFEETIYTTPSRADLAEQHEIARTVQQAVLALGLTHGPLHAEVRVNSAGVWMLEAAPRPIGGLCAKALRFTGGMPLEELHARHALGMHVENIEREDQAAGVMMIPVPEAGVLESVEGTPEASSVPGIEEVLISAKPGQRLVPWPEGNSYPGFIFARGDSPEFVEQALRQAHAKLRFKISRTLPVL